MAQGQAGKLPCIYDQLSHNQLISAKEQLNRKLPHYYNSKLYEKFAPYFDRVLSMVLGART